MADVERVVGFLNNVPLFRGLNERQLEQLAKSFRLREYEAGEAILSQGRGAAGFFIIESGEAEVIRERADGTEVVVNTFGPTDFFGELALLHEGSRTASVVAAEDTQCLALSRWDFLGILKGDADMAVTILQEVAGRFRAALDVL